MSKLNTNSQSGAVFDGSSPLEVITLGTAAGPAIRSRELGMSTAIVVSDTWYIVDFGLGSTRAASQAGLPGSKVAAAFITHMHSDHVVELPAFFLWNWGVPVNGVTTPVPIYGPGDGEINGNHIAGTTNMIMHLFEAYSADIQIRQYDEARPALDSLFVPHDIPTDLSKPTEIYRDDLVRVSAVLVDHPPVELAYAFRFDTPNGSVTISGDTAECDALVELAKDTDILIHEAVNLEFFREDGFSSEFVQHQENSHTPPEAAGRVAQRAGAKNLVLSHFAGPASDEFWKTKAQESFDGPVIVAKSGDRFAVSQRR